jgi:M6 family metalloprotease-like protein
MVLLLAALLFGASLAAFAAPPAPWAANQQEQVKDSVGNRARSTRAGRGIREIGASVPVNGVVRLLAIPVEFEPDVDPKTSGTGTFPYRTWGPAAQPGYLENRLRQVAQYYAEVSGNRLMLQTTLADIVRLPGTMAEYKAALDSNNIAVFASIMSDTIAMTDAKIDYSVYDIIILIHAGAGSEMNPMAGNTDIWSHYSVLPAGGLQTNDPAIVVGWGVLPETQCNDGIFAQANPAINIQTYERDPAAFAGVFVPHYWDVVGVWAHEIGHAFGLPDLYDTIYSGGLSLEEWSLMAGGSYLPEPDDTTEPDVSKIPYDPGRTLFSSVPCHPDAWCKQLVGWTSTIYVTGRRQNEVILPQAGTSGIIYRLWTNGNSSSSEYFLAENRAKIGYDRYLPSAGLMIYHIDDSVGSLDWNNLQWDQLHPRVKPMASDNLVDRFVVSADGKMYYYGVSVDAAYPGTLNNTHFGADTIPASTSYTGAGTFVDINNIRISGNNVIADLMTSTGAVITFTTPNAGATLYVTKPIIRVSAPYLDPATLTVSLNGQLLIGAAKGNVAFYYDANTGQLTIPLDGTLAGPLTVGDYQIVVTGQDALLAKAVSQTLSFSVREKTLPADMRMISLPVVNIGTVPMVFIGQTNFELARYNPLTKSYLTYPDPFVELTTQAGAAYDRQDPTKVMAPAGKAYWSRKFSSAAALRLAGDLVPNDRQYVVPLYAGFNMVGTPYNYPVSFGSVLLEYNGTTYSIGEAAQAGLLDAVLYAWMNGTYAIWSLPNGVMEPWEGYWLHCHVGTATNPLRLIFQPVSAGRSVTVQAPARSRGTAALWSLPVKVAGSAGTGAASVTLGVVPQATDGVDRGLDLYAPPSAPGGIGLSSTPTRGGGALFADYRAAASTITWNIDVSGPVGSTLTLTWSDLTRLPAKTLVTLRDTVTGEERYLRTAPQYKVTLGANETRRRLIITVAPGVMGAVQIQGLRAERSRAIGGARISAQLSLPAVVTVEIRTMTGMLIRRLPGGSRAAGAITVTWDGNDAHGRAVPRGTYQCHLLAVTGNGQSAKASTLMPPL